jgi:predicted nuclease of restriction endonuclease-like RecB superfamily
MTNKVRNKFEQRINQQLKRSKIIYGYETERIPYVLAGHYIPDFIIQTQLGKVYVECKGYLRPEDKRKLRAVKRQHPEMDLRLLFYGESTKRERDQIRWATKNGFKFAIDTIPKDWLKGL